MRTRIIQLETAPIKEEAFIKASHFTEQEKDLYNPDFFTSISSFVSDNCERENDVNYFFYQLQKNSNDLITVNPEESSFTLLFNSKKAYFANKKEELILLVNEIQQQEDLLLFEDMFIALKLEELANDRTGLYILIEEKLMTLDKFMRTVNDNETYYIGGTLELYFKNK